MSSYIPKAVRFWRGDCNVALTRKNKLIESRVMGHIFAATIMFLITVGTATLLFVPMTRFPAKNDLVNFYWAGIWVFLAMIAAFAGGVNTLMLVDIDVMKVGNAILAGTVAAFVLFVMFGWGRLSLFALLTLKSKVTGEDE